MEWSPTEYIGLSPSQVSAFLKNQTQHKKKKKQTTIPAAHTPQPGQVPVQCWAPWGSLSLPPSLPPAVPCPRGLAPRGTTWLGDVAAPVPAGPLATEEIKPSRDSECLGNGRWLSYFSLCSRSFFWGLYFILESGWGLYLALQPEPIYLYTAFFCLFLSKSSQDDRKGWGVSF